jgi:outer membrane receptor protein involved in Fe transport
MKRTITFLSLFLWLLNPILSQQKISGKVLDQSNVPLIGASIAVTGTSIGTVTDFDGSFELTVPEKTKSIEISYTGYLSQVITITNQTQLTIILAENILQLQDVVVTANKKTQSLQSVPMAITALSPVQIRRSGAKEFRDYATGIPNLSYGTQGSDGGGRYSNEISIRGITGINTTAMYLDETPLPESIDPNLSDIARVEVLKGPQGTLYGSATMGGAIKVVSNKPNPLQTEGSFGVTGSTVAEGDFNYKLNGVYNLPLSKKLAFRAAAYYDFESGVYDRVVNKDIEVINAVPRFTEDFYGDEIDAPSDGCPNCSLEDKENIDDKRNYGFNASLGFYPTKNISIIPKVIHQQEHGDGYDFAEVDVNNFTQNSNTGIDETFDDKWTHYSLGAEIKLGAGKIVSSTSYLDRFYTETEDVSDINTLWWIEYETEQIKDLIWADDVERSVGTRLFQQELRYESNLGGKFDFLLGGFYRREKQDWKYLDERPGMAAWLLSDNAYDPEECPDCSWDYDYVMANQDAPWYRYDGFFDEDEFALFGQFYYSITDRLKATVGFRYFTASQLKDIEEDGADFGFMPLALRDNTRESGFNPKFNLTYQLNKDQLVYATAVRGFRLGDINENLPSFCLEELEAHDNNFPRFFKSDFVWNYELGFKGSWANGRIITNAAIFYNNWGNLQQYRFLDCGWGYTSNVGRADTKGLELDIRVKANKNLEISGGIGLLDPVIAEGGAFLEAEANDRILYAPKVTGNLAASYSISLNEKTTLFFNANMQHSGERLGTYSPEDSPEGIFPAYTFVNTRIGLQMPKYEISLFGNNITNIQANYGDIQSFAGNIPGRPRYATNRPRTIGLQGRIYF